jgi:ketosteroid isomerase-like protein
MKNIEEEIVGIVNRETRAWDTKDIKLLMTIFHTEEGDGAFAVVDVDTLWRDAEGNDSHWKGRACKVYTKVGREWKMIMHTGLLDYEKA